MLCTIHTHNSSVPVHHILYMNMQLTITMYTCIHVDILFKITYLQCRHSCFLEILKLFYCPICALMFPICRKLPSCAFRFFLPIVNALVTFLMGKQLIWSAVHRRVSFLLVLHGDLPRSCLEYEAAFQGLSFLVWNRRKLRVLFDFGGVMGGGGGWSSSHVCCCRVELYTHMSGGKGTYVWPFCKI